ncbi:hypothetical protein F6T96_000784 [Enterobacter hormaechei]|nr:hypothetical protein [Enterobacter hormaechei]
MSNAMMGAIVITPAVNESADKMSAQQLDMFEIAFKNFEGAGFKPLMYIGHQLVAGERHTYIAERTIMLADGVMNSIAKVKIFKSLDNNLVIESIIDI